MGTSYEQFLACLRNSAARRLLGLDMTDEEAAALGADPEAARAYYEAWTAGRAISSGPPPRTTPQAAAPRS